MYEEITQQAKTVVTELLEQAKLRTGSLFAVGCSSSEMVGKRIGKGSSMDAAQAAFKAKASIRSFRSREFIWPFSAASI